MKTLFWSVCAALIALVCLGPVARAQSDPELEKVLNEMDAVEKTFRSTQAKFVWNQYTAAVKDMDKQVGKIYFRRAGNDTQMAVDVTDPPKYVLLTGGKVQLYEPKIDKVTVYNLQKTNSDFESFLKLGFGGGGHSMLKSFDVKYIGTDSVGGITASMLDLVPRAPKVEQMFPHITLWIDPARGISVQQKLFQGGGDYRLAIYSDIVMNQKISDNVFKLKTTGKTTFQTMSQ